MPALAGVAADGASQILAAGALPLMVLDWADIEQRNATCDVIRRCALPAKTSSEVLAVELCSLREAPRQDYKTVRADITMDYLLSKSAIWYNRNNSGNVWTCTHTQGFLADSLNQTMKSGEVAQAKSGS